VMLARLLAARVMLVRLLADFWRCWLDS
jgi:hypothetical protein